MFNKRIGQGLSSWPTNSFWIASNQLGNCDIHVKSKISIIYEMKQNEIS
jgi:hypothetical protein